MVYIHRTMVYNIINKWEKGYNMTTAKFDTKSTPIASEFGENLARKWFGDEVVDRLPRYVKGEKAGQIKGWLKWKKCVSGGWVRRAYVDGTNVLAGGNVARPNEIRNKVIEVDFNTLYIIKCEPMKDVEDWEGHKSGDIDSLIASKKDDLGKKSKLKLEWVQNATDEDDIKFHKTVDSEKLTKRDIAQYADELKVLEHKKRYGGIIIKLAD